MSAVLAAVTEGVGDMRVREVPEPGDPGVGELVVRPDAVGLCGSDYHFFDGGLTEAAGGGRFPRVQGHEGRHRRIRRFHEELLHLLRIRHSSGRRPAMSGSGKIEQYGMIGVGDPHLRE